MGVSIKKMEQLQNVYTKPQNSRERVAEMKGEI